MTFCHPEGEAPVILRPEGPKDLYGIYALTLEILRRGFAAPQDDNMNKLIELRI